jgi:hypothetical protein
LQYFVYNQLSYTRKAIIDMPASVTTATAADYLRAAIGCWEAEINQLTALGIREGSISRSTTGTGYAQYHWCNGSKRFYLAKKNVEHYQAEINRGREVAELQRKIASAQALMARERTAV